MEQNLPHTIQVRLKSYSITELADFYEVPLKILKSWLEDMDKELGNRRGHFYTPKQVKIIFEEFGIPRTLLVCCDFDED